MKVKGFTLVELLMVIVVIAILTSLAVPTYIKTVEKVRAKEAITNLQIIRVAENMYMSENGSYTANLASIDDINTTLNLDIEAKFWTYGFGLAFGNYYSIATRDVPGTAYDGDTIILKQDDGVWFGDSPFRP